MTLLEIAHKDIKEFSALIVQIITTNQNLIFAQSAQTMQDKLFFSLAQFWGGSVWFTY